jgi:type I restriction enzyme, S subunit
VTLPRSWLQTIAGEACALVQSGGTPKAGFIDKPGIPFLKVYNIVNQNISFDYRPQFVTEGVHKGELRKSRILPDDVLMNIVGPPLGKVAIVPPTFPEWNANQALTIFRPSSAVISRWLYYFLCGGSSVQSVINETRGSAGQVNISLSQCRNFEISLPPAAEQRRIVAKVDSLSAKSRRAREHIDHIPRLVEKYKQAILVDAFNGNLITRIRPKEGWPDWSFDLARNVCLKVQSGGTPKEGFAGSGIPFLKVYNIVDQKIAFDYKPQYVSVPVHERALRKSQTIPGDVLMNIVGPPLGKVGIVPDTFAEWNINQAITLFRPSERLLSKWIYYFLCSGISVDEVTHKTKGSAGQVNISLSQCRDFTFPVPSIAEQEHIIRFIEIAFTWIDRIASETVSVRGLIDHLDQSILAKAFRGELVPQDTNDEPASVLLERIRAERNVVRLPTKSPKAKLKKTRREKR